LRSSSWKQQASFYLPFGLCHRTFRESCVERDEEWELICKVIVAERLAVNENELIVRVSQGDRHALALLYDQFASILFPLALRILSDRQRAEEVLQDVFVQVWQSARSFEGGQGTVLGWMIKLTRELARTRMTAQVGSVPVARAVVESSNDLADNTGDGEERRRVRRALESLAVEQRMALELAYFQGLTPTEIAERLGEPIGSIKRQLQLGMTQLRKSLS
jgi:RNA polymerase sigma-70 factor (ECF subfamily)